MYYCITAPSEAARRNQPITASFISSGLWTDPPSAAELSSTAADLQSHRQGFTGEH